MIKESIEAYIRLLEAEEWNDMFAISVEGMDDIGYIELTVEECTKKDEPAIEFLDDSLLLKELVNDEDEEYNYYCIPYAKIICLTTQY